MKFDHHNLIHRIAGKTIAIRISQEDLLLSRLLLLYFMNNQLTSISSTIIITSFPCTRPRVTHYHQSISLVRRCRSNKENEEKSQRIVCKSTDLACEARGERFHRSRILGQKIERAVWRVVEDYKINYKLLVTHYLSFVLSVHRNQPFNNVKSTR